MKAPTTGSKPVPQRRALQRRWGPGGGCVWWSCGLLAKQGKSMNRTTLDVARLADRHHVERLVIIPMLVMFGWFSAVNASNRSVKPWKFSATFCGTNDCASLLSKPSHVCCALARAIRRSFPSAAWNVATTPCALASRQRLFKRLAHARWACCFVRLVDSSARLAYAGFGRATQTEHAHSATCSIDALRNTAQSTSGLRSSQRTAPLVARSIDGQCAAGTFPRSVQLQTVCTDLPIDLAKAAGPPEISIARVSAFMSQ